MKQPRGRAKRGCDERVTAERSEAIMKQPRGRAKRGCDERVTAERSEAHTNSLGHHETTEGPSEARLRRESNSRAKRGTHTMAERSEAIIKQARGRAKRGCDERVTAERSEALTRD